jgi:hypothetical protein
MYPVEALHKALARLRGWVPASEVAERTGLPLPEVRRALRELAAANRAKRDIYGKWGKDKLEERWSSSSTFELFPPELTLPGRGPDIERVLDSP